MMIGKGSANDLLTRDDVRHLCETFVAREGLAGKRVLGIIPDHTRTAPIDLLFRTLSDLLRGGSGAFDLLIALGTHPAMTDEAIDRRLGLAPGERATTYARTKVFNHAWDDLAQLRSIGHLSADDIAAISGGLMKESVDITVNKLVFDYDVVLIIGPTFPHEVVGFSGGNKYLFPGVSGREIIDMFHWLGALITNPSIIGRKWTPVRKVVDAAAHLLPVKRLCMSLVVKNNELAGMYCGEPEEAWSAAADLSDQVHIIYKEKPFTSVLSCAPPMYDELWVGGKCAYKLEPVVADGGELIIYAPHIREISVTHGRLIRKVGYHVRDYFTKQPGQYTDIPRGVLAHSTHVKGIGTFENGVERPRITVTLATGIPEEICRAVNLGYRDPSTIDAIAWMGKEEEGILHVPKAGEILYRLKNDPFAK